MSETPTPTTDQPPHAPGDAHTSANPSSTGEANTSANTKGTATSSEPPPPADAVNEELVQLRQSLEKAEKQLDEALRQLAEMDNVRKRALRDVEVEKKSAIEKFAFDLLTAFDNLDRAVGEAKKEGQTGPLVQGVLATHNQLLQIFKRHGVTPIEVTLGQEFNPHHHLAVMQQPSTEHPVGSVTAVLQQGFLLHDRVLRPCAVVVAAATTTTTTESA